MHSAQPAIQLSPLQWNSLQHIDDVKKIGEDDSACLEEVRAVLEKHGCLSRFGLSLLHSHFDVADDEILLETTDTAKREHWVRPVKLAELRARNIEVQTTVVRFDERGYSQYCSCARDTSGHTGGHMG